jgi:hypothetical protein
MTDQPIELDAHRGMAARKATELRRLVSEIAADRAKLRARPSGSCTASAMNENRTTLERAFQLAQSGRCGSVKDIRRVLAVEGFSPKTITGRSLNKQLSGLIRSAQGLRDAGTPSR